MNANGYNYENRALTPASFRPKVKTANRDELAANISRPIFIVGVGVSSCSFRDVGKYFCLPKNLNVFLVEITYF